MASLHLDRHDPPRSKYWYVAYTTASGKRTFRSTKTTDRAAALKIARTLERASFEAKKKQLTESCALKLLSEFVEHTTGEPIRNYTVTQWLREWLSAKKVETSASTFTKYESSINRFLSSLGSRADINLRAVLPSDIRDCRESERASGKSPTTCNDYLGTLRSAFDEARRQGLIVHNPAEAVKRLKNDSEPARQPFTVQQVQSLLRATDGDWHGAILAGFYTGTRLHDTANLRWENVDLDKRLLSYRASKTGKKVQIPIHDALYAHLRKQIRGIGKAPLFKSLTGKSTSFLSREFGKVMEHAGVHGVTARVRQGKSSRAVNTLTFHSLRHAYASMMANAGVSEEIRMKLAGHASKDVHAGYTHHEMAVLRTAVGQLPSLPR
jgi:integrase